MKNRMLASFSRKLAVATCAVYLSLSLPAYSIDNGKTNEGYLNTPRDFTEVAKKVIPSVVSVKIKTTGKNRARNTEDNDPYQDFFNDDFFGRFFFGLPNRGGNQPSLPQISQASGFIVSPDGYILTNNHVVDSHGNITVTLNDGREYPAKIIGEDDGTDIAVIKIEASNLPYLKLGNSSNLEVGQWAIAVGNPFGLQASLTVGVISAKGRNNLDLARIEDFIQTDASINQGNSGGPLLNVKGEVIGINTAIATQGNSGSMGIGFAIPSNIALNVMDQLIATGSVTRGFIGVILQPIDNDLAQAFGLKKIEGALVAEVTKGSPAEKAGLKQGDIILKYNDQSIENIAGLRNAIAMMKPGSKIALSILRDKKPEQISLEIGTFPEDKKMAVKAEKADNVLGIEVENLNPEIARNLGFVEEKGVVVTFVEPYGPAAMVGLKKGALILTVNQKKVETKEQFFSALNETEKGKPILLLIKQGNMMRYVSIKVEA